MADHRNQVSADLERLRAYWNRRARSRLPDLEKLEWTARRTQRLRFDAFLDAHDLGGKSVLDVGCGLGDFYAHIRRRGLSVEYTGYDLSEGMIEL